MNMKLTRRDALKLMGSAAIGSGLMGSIPVSGAVPPPRAVRDSDMRGIFVILSTHYTESGSIDYEDMAFQIEWLDHAGVHGLVWPQNSSDYTRLTYAEIKRGMEVLTDANRGRSMTLVLGVQQDSTAEMVELARFAEGLEPDMMIAMPPKVWTSLADYRTYYSALARTTERPVILQTQPNLPGIQFETDLILELADRFPHLGYVKEEAEPVFDRIQALIGQPQVERVYSAMRGRYFAYDLRLGVDGLVSGMSMYAEVFVRMWEAHLAGDWDQVRDIHGRLLVMLTCEQEIPAAGRYLLQRRGIFRSLKQRGRALELSDVEMAEIEHNLRGLEPYLKQVPRRGA